jgi:CheY-like chemotaxis protein
LCEDNDINTEIARRLLEGKGFIVQCAKNGEIGVNLFKQSKEGVTNFSFDAILMDVRMPIMNGLEATKIIRKIDKNIPIIALSANAYKSDIDKSLEAGMNVHLMKPLDFQILFKKLSELIK